MTDVKELTRTALQTASKASPTKGGALSKPAGLAAAGVAVAALPVVAERVAKLVGPKVSELGDQAKEQVTEKAKDKVSEITPDLSEKMPGGGLLGKVFGGGDDGEQGAGKGSAAPGHGSGRRMPIQQSVDVAVPIKTAYNQWTRFEDWPDFMHRLESVDQTDDATVAFQTKVWGIKKRFEAQIVEQRPDERIEWDVSQGLAHSGVVTFHRLSNRLTRIEVTLDIEPDSLVEKAGRGWRFAKRAVRGDLHRFKAHVELSESSDRGWRGTIKDGKVTRRTERRQTASRSRGSRNGASANGRSRSSARGRARSGGGKSS
jgi:uncharacterized membrane protein